MIIKLKWALFVTYTIIQSITSSEMCSLHLTHPSAHTTGAVEETLRHSGRSWGFSALLKGLTSVVDNSCRSRDSSPQSQVTSPTLYPLEPRLLEVQCEVSTVSDDLGCHVICWCWSTLFSEVHSQRSHLPGNFRALHASFCWQALWRCWFHFPAGLGTCAHCQMYQKLVQWPWCYCAWLASNLAWPEPQ